MRGKVKVEVLTPKRAAERARYLETKRLKDLERLNELRRMKALDRMQEKREDAATAKPISLKELIGSKTRERAIKTMVSTMLTTRDDRLRVDCAKWLIDRTDGPITNNVSVGGRDGQPIVIRDERPNLETLIGNFAKQYYQLQAGEIIEGDVNGEAHIYKESDDPPAETKGDE